MYRREDSPQPKPKYLPGARLRTTRTWYGRIKQRKNCTRIDDSNDHWKDGPAPRSFLGFKRQQRTRDGVVSEHWNTFKARLEPKPHQRGKRRNGPSWGMRLLTWYARWRCPEYFEEREREEKRQAARLASCGSLNWFSGFSARGQKVHVVRFVEDKNQSAGKSA